MYLLCVWSLESLVAIRWGGIKLEMDKLGEGVDEVADVDDKDEDKDAEDVSTVDEANEEDEDLSMEDKA